MSDIISNETPSVKELLSELHEVLAKELLVRLRCGDATSAEMSVAVKLLKNNDVSVVLEESKPMLNLVEALPFTEEAKKKAE